LQGAQLGPACEGEPKDRDDANGADGTQPLGRAGSTGTNAVPLPGGSTDRPAAGSPSPLDSPPDSPDPNENEGCKETLTARDRDYQKAYRALCTEVGLRVLACHDKPDFTRGLGIDDRRHLGAFFGSSAEVEETCDSYAHDQHCNYQGMVFSQPWSARDLRKLEAAPHGDCVALRKRMPMISGYTSE
jgi:hypothetical protein